MATSEDRRGREVDDVKMKTEGSNNDKEVSDKDKDSLEEDETEHVILDISSSRRGNTVISVQPHLKDAEESRIPIPITVSRLDSRLRQVIPLSGLQLLYDVTRLRIQQTFDIHHLTSDLTSENRYVIRNGNMERGEALFGCCENSATWQRLVCGARRRFHMTVVDQTQQEAITFHRRLASTIPQLGVYLQRMEAHLPGGQYIGCVEQEWSPGYPKFSVKDANSELLYKIRANACCTCIKTDFVFYIINAEDTEVLSHISHEWDRDLVDYNLSVVLPPTQSVKSKALVIAAAFLFEYIYFLPSKEGSCTRSCCK